MKTILITGASSGIGKASAEKLSKGNKVILCARNKSVIEDIAQNIPGALAFKMDVRNNNEVEQVFLSLEMDG